MLRKKQTSKIEGYLYQYPITITAFLFLLYGAAYSGLENRISQFSIVIDTGIDHLIPFSVYASLPYGFWHLEIAVILFFFLIKQDYSGYWSLVAKLLCGLFFILFLCALIPNEVQLRPDTVGGTDFFSVLTQVIYSVDDNRNVFPSGHAFGLVLMIKYWNKYCSKVWHYACSYGINIAILAATFVLKQHSIIDAVGGIILALLVNRVIDYLQKKRDAAQKNQTHTII